MFDEETTRFWHDAEMVLEKYVLVDMDAGLFREVVRIGSGVSGWAEVLEDKAGRSGWISGSGVKLRAREVGTCDASLKGRGKFVFVMQGVIAANKCADT